MLKMLIVDDEKIIRDGLSGSINWNLHGIEICGVKSDGSEALEFCRNEVMPDIIITDIKMSKMSGLDFIEELDNDRGDTKVIIISGFDDFEFLKRALHNNIFEYLLKPVKPKEITDAVVRARDIILEKREVELRRKKYLDRVEKNIDIIRSRYLSELACGVEHFDEETDIISLLRLNLLPDDRFFVMAISLTEVNNIAYYLILTEFRNDDKFYMFSGLEGGYGIVCRADGETYSSAASEVQRRILNSYDCNVSIGVSGIFTGLKSLPMGWEEAKIALDCEDITGGNQVIYYEKIDGSQILLEMNEDKLDRDIIEAVDRLDKTEIENILLKFISENPQISSESFQKTACKIVMSAFGYIMKIDESPEKILGDWQTVSARIKSFAEMDGLIGFCVDFFKNVVDGIVEINSVNSSPVIEQIKQYIDENIDKPFSLKRISQIVYLSPNYVSTLFRRETGKKLKDYVVEMRIEKAKVFLKNSAVKIYEVSEMVGYSDSRYFGNLFKKSVGMSPAEYRKLINNK